ncbi:hypothetical protein [Veillonella magna]|uniref:hypothetical protein n=1 Tax=Veillonella magna TaxID=464322 RepID=UPI0023F38306|nr:hypothetical protein [Veillonella magna]MBD8976826.1 hypothetical protein [Veillonella magna]
MDDNQVKLGEVLKELSSKDSVSDEEKIRKYIHRLQSIYQPEFRHFYSNIFAVITEIDGDSGKATSERDIVTLQQNINVLYSCCIDGDFSEEFKLCLRKLYDHVNLDIARLEYTKRLVDKINESNTITNNELRGVKAKAEQMQKEYVTILGIFSSIVLTFVAGMFFSSAVLSNIDKTTIYRLVFVMSLIGLMLFNLFHFLLDYIQRINGGVVVDKGQDSLISGINVFIGIIMFVDFILWLAYWWRFS